MEKKTNLHSAKPITYKDMQFNSYAEAARYLGKTVGAISKTIKRYGTLDPKDTPTDELLQSGKLGKIYKSTREARNDLGITTEWSTFMMRVNRGIPINSAKSDENYKAYKEFIQKNKSVKFKSPIEIDGKLYYYYGDIVSDYKDKFDEIASAQTIRKRKRAGVTSINLIITRKHETKRKDLSRLNNDKTYKG